MINIFRFYVLGFIAYTVIRVMALYAGFKTVMLMLGVYLLGTLLITCISFWGMRKRASRREQSGRGGYIYAFTDLGLLFPVVKIGRETEKGSRLASHNTAAPFGLFKYSHFRVPDAVASERFLHDRYAKWRIGRTEWFWMTPAMLIELLLLWKFGVY